jgi:signal transduction histidine kinase
LKANQRAIQYPRKRLAFIVLFLFLVLTSVQHVFAREDLRELDSLKKALSQNPTNDSIQLHCSWLIAKYFDDHNQFDSMQYWLNTGKEKLSVSDTQITHFHYAAYQSIAYYYNGLLQMDLYESYKVLAIARKLKDSILLATGYNFVGLANSNIKEFEKAIPYFYAGMPYAKQPPFLPKYKVASKPHHLHGNLAEAYYKLNRFDSALVHARQSLILATAIESKRGVAVAKNLLGLIYNKLNVSDSAQEYQLQALEEGKRANEMDVALIACSALATMYHSNLNYTKALLYLDMGFKLKEENENINYYFTKQFLDDALFIYQKSGNEKGALKCLRWMNANNERINKITDQQVIKIIEQGIKNELRANTLSLKKSEQDVRLGNLKFMIALIAFLATGLLLILYFLYNNRRLKEIALRQQISRDLHDDINATLSSIKLFGELSIQEQHKKNAYAISITEKITQLSGDLMDRVSDVIYVLKNDNPSGDRILTRIKSIAHDLLTPKEIKPIIQIEEEVFLKMTNPIFIKNIFLIIKEALHNVAKYSNATQCTIALYSDDKYMILKIQDNGIGYSSTCKPGNGIENMKFRCNQMQGTFDLIGNPGEGTEVICTFSLSIFRH